MKKISQRNHMEWTFMIQLARIHHFHTEDRMNDFFRIFKIIIGVQDVVFSVSGALEACFPSINDGTIQYSAFKFNVMAIDLNSLNPCGQLWLFTLYNINR